MLPQKIIENVHIAKAILLLFEQFLGKFASFFSICASSKMLEIMEKIVFIKSIVETGWWRRYISHILHPLDPPLLAT